MKKVKFNELARNEFMDALRFYTDNGGKKSAGRFKEEFKKALEFIKQFPEGGHKVSAGMHRLLFKKFPFCLIYSIEENELYIASVMHFSKEPDYWIDRVKT